MKLYCATGNPGKLREFHLAGALCGVEIEPLPGIAALPSCREIGSSFEENAILKAAYYSAFAPGPLFADDSGLEVNSLGGDPGIFSARYAGVGATDADNNDLLLKNLANGPDRRARFVCVIALSNAGRILQTFRGEVEGEILREPRGGGGFGYDPLFYYAPFQSSFGELSPERKFEVSHRGLALPKMLAYARSLPLDGSGRFVGQIAKDTADAGYRQ